MPTSALFRPQQSAGVLVTSRSSGFYIVELALSQPATGLGFTAFCLRKTCSAIDPARNEHYCRMHLRDTLPWRRIHAVRSHEATVIMLHRADVGSVMWMSSERVASYPSMNNRTWHPLRAQYYLRCVVMNRGRWGDQQDADLGKPSLTL